MARNSFSAYSNEFGSSLQKSTVDLFFFKILEIWWNICFLTYFFEICFCWFSSSIVQMSILQIFKTKIWIKLSAKNVFTLIHFRLHKFFALFSISSYFFITHIMDGITWLFLLKCILDIVDITISCSVAKAHSSIILRILYVDWTKSLKASRI